MPRLDPLWLVLALAACGGAGSTTTSPPPPPPPPGSGNPPASASVAMTTSDDVYGSSVSAFNPSGVTIARSGTVTWTNNSGVQHNVTFDPKSGVPSNVPNMTQGSASRSFTVAGTFPYRCTNHTGMSGQITVQ